STESGVFVVNVTGNVSITEIVNETEAVTNETIEINKTAINESIEINETREVNETVQANETIEVINETIETNKTEEIIEEEPTITKFRNKCEETCRLEGFNDSSYTLVIELENAKLNISSISYTIIKMRNVTNRAPEFKGEIDDITFEHNQSYSLDLKQHFSDADEDNLTYSYGYGENLTIEFEKGIMIVSSRNNFIGENELFITAYDQESSAESNIFLVNVSGEIIREAENVTLNVTEEINITKAKVIEETLRKKERIRVGRPVR
ncbi:unnamed protein product, partial [marine sediment metagenome]